MPTQAYSTSDRRTVNVSTIYCYDCRRDTPTSKAVMGQDEALRCGKCDKAERLAR